MSHQKATKAASHQSKIPLPTCVTGVCRQELFLDRDRLPVVFQPRIQIPEGRHDDTQSLVTDRKTTPPSGVGGIMNNKAFVDCKLGPKMSESRRRVTQIFQQGADGAVAPREILLPPSVVEILLGQC